MGLAQRYGGVIPEPFGSQCNEKEDKNIGNINDWWDAFCYTFLDFVEYIDLKR